MFKKAFFTLSVAAALALAPSAASAQRGFHGGWHGGGWGGGWRGGGWGVPAVGIGIGLGLASAAAWGPGWGWGGPGWGAGLGSTRLELRSVWRLHAMASHLDRLGLAGRASECVLVRRVSTAATVRASWEVLAARVCPNPDEVDWRDQTPHDTTRKQLAPA